MTSYCCFFEETFYRYGEIYFTSMQKFSSELSQSHSVDLDRTILIYTRIFGSHYSLLNFFTLVLPVKIKTKQNSAKMGHKSLCRAMKLALGSMFPLCPIPPQHSNPCCTQPTDFTDTGTSFLQDTTLSCFKGSSSYCLLLLGHTDEYLKMRDMLEHTSKI